MNGNIGSVNSDATIQVVDVSKWYGSVVAVNDVSFDVGPGITGLLGPNGAGKTTLLHLISGLAGCSKGDITMFGEPVRDNPDLYRRVGFMPEHESTYDFYTGRQLVEFSAKLNNLSPMKDYIDRAISIVGLEEAQDRKMGTYSRGMKQRMRLAATLVHGPAGHHPGRAAQRNRPAPANRVPGRDGTPGR